jgi:heptaprenylglyceryl phosphate synthase
MLNKFMGVLLFVSILLFTITASFSVYSIYNIWDKSHPVKVIDLHSLKIITYPVIAGQYFQYEVCYTKHIEAIGSVAKQLTNTTVVTYAEKTATLGVGKDCVKRWEWIPSYAESDIDYRLVWTVTYPDIDGHKVLPVTISTDKFEVRGKAPCKKEAGK